MTSEIQQPSMNASPFWMRLVPYIGMFLLALLLWLPFGFKPTGLIEEIGINELLDKGEQLFFVTPYSAMQDHASRPLEVFVHQLAYVLDPNSFLFYNIFQMLFFVGKMCIVYMLVLEFLPERKILAFVTGVLFTIYPGDTGLFALRTIHIHCAVFAYLVSAYLLVVFWKRHGRTSWLALFGAVLFILFSLAQYEIALVAAAFTPFALLYFARPNRRFFIGMSIWYVAIVVIVLYETWAGHQTTLTYEGVMIEKSSLALDGIFEALFLGYLRQIWGWANAFNQLNFLSLFWPYIGTGILLCLGVIGWLFRQPSNSNEKKPIASWKYAVLLIGGVLFFGVGVAAYLPFPSHRLQDFRVYFLAMLGPALFLSLGLYLISRLFPRFRDIIFAVFTLPFIGLAFLSAFQQQQYYVNFSLEQQSILQQTVEQAPQVKPDTIILMIDRTGILDQGYVFSYGVYLSSMMHYLYEDESIKSNYCAADNGVTVLGVSCKFEQNTVEMTSTSKDAAGLLPKIATDKLLIFSTKIGGGVQLMSAEEAAKQFNITGYDPQARITGQVLPHRAATMFSCYPAMSCYKLPGAPSTTFDLPAQGEIGVGWRTPEDDGGGGTFRWAVRSISAIDVNLIDSSDLSLDFKVLHWVDGAVIDSLKLTVNDQNILFTFSPTDDGGRLYHATIPRSVLVGQPSRTNIIFTVDRLSPNQVDVPLGFAINWLRIRPTSSEP